MRTIVYGILFIVFFFSMSIHAQVEFLVEVDQATGEHVKIDSISGVNWITTLPSYSTFDEANGHYIFRGANSNFEEALYTVDAVTAEIIYAPDFPVLEDPSDNVIDLQFDNVTGTLFGLHWNSSEETEYFVSVDQITGEYDLIAAIPDVMWISTAPKYTTFDELNGRYIFHGADADFNWKLYSISATTGAVLSSPDFPQVLDPQDNIIELQCDDSSGWIYGLHWDASLQTEHLVSVNPITGSYALINSIPGVMWITTSPDYTSFDDQNGNYIFYGSDEDFNWLLYTIDVITGEIMFDPTFPVLDEPSDNVIELEFDSSSGTLYGLHWDAELLPVGLSESYLTDEFTIYPNPMQEMAFVQFPGEMKDVTLKLYDHRGALLRTIGPFTGQQVEVQRRDLDAGIYYLQLLGSSRNSLVKLVVE